MKEEEACCIKRETTQSLCSEIAMNLLHPTNSSYNNFINESSENVASSLLTSIITPSNISKTSPSYPLRLKYSVAGNSDFGHKKRLNLAKDEPKFVINNRPESFMYKQPKSFMSQSISTSLPKDNKNLFYTRKEFKGKLKYIVKRLLPRSQKNAWLAFEDMLNLNNEESTIFTSHMFMAKRGRYSERTSKTIMSLLNELGIILKHRRGFKKSNMYFINWNLVYERPDLLEGYASRVKCKTCTLSSSSTEEVIIINNNQDNIIEKEVLEEKKYSVEEFCIGKNVSARLSTKGISTIAQYFWRDKFRIVAKDDKPWNGEKEWDIVNAHFAFVGFIHRERAKQRELGLKYICPIVRKAFRNKPKTSIVSPKEEELKINPKAYQPAIKRASEPKVDLISVDDMDSLLESFRNNMRN